MGSNPNQAARLAHSGQVKRDRQVRGIKVVSQTRRRGVTGIRERVAHLASASYDFSIAGILPTRKSSRGSKTVLSWMDAVVGTFDLCGER